MAAGSAWRRNWGFPPAQTAKIKAIRDASRSQRDALRKNTALKPADAQAKETALRDVERKQIEAVLTPAQKQKWTQAMQMRRAGGQGRMGRMTDQLNLTASQKAQMQKINTAAMAKMQALQGQKLTEQERQTKMRAVFQGMRSQIEAILTPAQKQKMASLSQSAAGRRRRAGTHGRRASKLKNARSNSSKRDIGSL